MGDHDSPISLHGGGKTLAKLAVEEQSGHWPIPEGTVLASAVTRIMSYMMDTIFVMGILYLITSLAGGQAGSIVQAYNLGLLTMGGKGIALFFIDWGLILSANYLYYKYTGIKFSRSLGQRWFGLGVVREDGGELGRGDWGRRAMRKSLYALPLVGLFWFGIRDLALIRKRHTHQSSIDLTVASIVVEGTSLPPASRKQLR